MKGRGRVRAIVIVSALTLGSSVMADSTRAQTAGTGDAEPFHVEWEALSYDLVSGPPGTSSAPSASP
jgi:hypothetical protein